MTKKHSPASSEISQPSRYDQLSRYGLVPAAIANLALATYIANLGLGLDDDTHSRPNPAHVSGADQAPTNSLDESDALPHDFTIPEAAEPVDLEQFWSCLTPSGLDYSKTDAIIAHDEKSAIGVSAEQANTFTHEDYEAAIQDYRFELADNLDLTLPDMRDVFEHLESEEMQSASLSEFTIYASEALSEKYGISIGYTPHFGDESSVPIEIASLDEAETALLKGNVIQAASSVNMFPVELIEMMNLKSITFAHIPPQDDGIQPAAYAALGLGDIVIKHDGELRHSTINHELYHFLDYQLCDGEHQNSRNDYNWKQLNPEVEENFYTNDYTNQTSNNPEYISVETAREEDIDISSPNVAVAKEDGFVNKLEDKATLGELILGNPTDRNLTFEDGLLRTLALAESPAGNKTRYLLAQLHAKNPAVLAWLVKSGDVATFIDEAVVSEHSFVLPEEMLAEYRSTDLFDDSRLSALRGE